MNNETKLEIFGTQELSVLFDELSKVNQDKIIKSGFRKSANIILKEAKSNLQGGKKHTVKGRIEKSFRISDIDKDNKLSGVKLGNTSYLSRWLEKGTKERNTKKYKGKPSKRFSGKINPLNFLQKATESKGEEASNTLFSNIKEAFDKLIKKYSK